MRAFCALMWKEWRETRAALFVFLALSLLLLVVRIDSLSGLLSTKDLAYVGFILFVPLFAAFVGANLIAPEVGEGTLSFLLARPLRPATVWLAKVSAGGLIVAAYYVFSWFLPRLWGIPFDKMEDGLRPHIAA